LLDVEAPTFCLGSEVISLKRRPPFTLRKIPGTHFCKRQKRPQDHSTASRIRSIEKFNDLVGNRTRDLPVCSIVPQPTTLLRRPEKVMTMNYIVCLECCCLLEDAENDFSDLKVKI
jgi:hypothetical protein